MSPLKVTRENLRDAYEAVWRAPAPRWFSFAEAINGRPKSPQPKPIANFAPRR